MADGSGIEWTDATWNPITGCSVVSPGCTNCYAMKLAGTRMKHHPSRAGLTVDSKAGPVWTGEVRFNEEWLDQPLRWQKPRLIFVCAHGDLFHESVPDEWIDRVFAVMALAPHHTFQVLTKRPERMRRYLGHGGTCIPVGIRHQAERIFGRDPGPLPIALPNVWLGVSAEDQERADERIPLLLATPAAVRWVSAEPLLGGINMQPWLDRLDWVVAGGESGPGARPMHPHWVQWLRDDCAKSGVAFSFKQWGDWFRFGERDVDGRVNTVSRGKHPLFWREMSGGEFMVRLPGGKKAAGRHLDGVIHNGYPEARRV